MPLTSSAVFEAVAQASRLVDLRQRRLITDALLISNIVDLVTPENIYEVMGALPPDLQKLFREWAGGLPPTDSPETVYWPLPSQTSMSFREWVSRTDAAKSAREHQNGDAATK